MSRTPQQEAFIEALAGSTSNITLEAVAGSGKTFTLVEGATETKAVGMALAFNKRNQEDLAKRMPPTIECKTMNALGHQAWQRQLGGRPNLDGNKIRGIISRMWSFQERMRTPGLDRFVDLLRLHEVVPNGAPFQGRAFRDSDSYFTDLVDNYDIDLEDGVDSEMFFGRARQVLMESIQMAWKKEIDFVDQLYMPVVYNAPFTPQPLVMVDEVQDLSPLQHKMVQRVGRNRVLAAGDPRQSIYGFAGAMSDSMEHFRKTFQAETLPLTWCFRCPQEVVRVAQKYNPVIESAPSAPHGKVSYMENLNHVEMGDVVLSYRNSALLEAAFNLIARGIGAQLVGSGDLGTQLVKLAKRFEFPRDRFLRGLKDWTDDQVRDLLAAEKRNQADRLRDKSACLQIILLSSNSKDQADLEESIKKIFALDGTRAPVLCSTIHKAKGLEWRRVHAYKFEDNFRGLQFLSPDAAQQRMNMSYVEVTRAQEELFFVSPKKESDDD